MSLRDIAGDMSQPTILILQIYWKVCSFTVINCDAIIIDRCRRRREMSLRDVAGDVRCRFVTSYALWNVASRHRRRHLTSPAIKCPIQITKIIENHPTSINICRGRHCTLFIWIGYFGQIFSVSFLVLKQLWGSLKYTKMFYFYEKRATYTRAKHL